MTITVDLVVLGSVGLVGLVAVCMVLMIVWCENAGETQDYRKAPRARSAATKRRVSERNAATSIEKALVSRMIPVGTSAGEERRSG